jgi:hypothetical protein
MKLTAGWKALSKREKMNTRKARKKDGGATTSGNTKLLRTRIVKKSVEKRQGK